MSGRVFPIERQGATKHPDTARGYAAAIPDLAELCRVHDIGMELIERCDDLDLFLEAVLEEYERRLADLPDSALDGRAGPADPAAARKLRALVLFATQAAALKEKAEAATELRGRSRSLEQIHAHLAGVMGAMGAGILMLGGDGTVLRCNRSAPSILGIAEEELIGKPVPEFVALVAPESDAEVAREVEGSPRVLLVARRGLEEGKGEVVLLSDVTARHMELEERHRIERLGEVLRTLSVLSHKINNPLTALMGRAQILQARQGTDPQVVKAATVIQESAQRIAELIRELAQVVKSGRQEAVDRVLTISDQGAPDAERA
jgi:PAS domain S-box-containing protein